MNMDFERKLAIPMEVKQMYPLDSGLKETVETRAEEIRNIFDGVDSRLLLIIGPCSADKDDSVIDYVTRLRKIQEKAADKIYIIPRIYTNKPRTDGSGYKGMLHRPDPSQKPDLFRGIIATRELHMRVLRETGFSCADEMLYPENHKYFDDLLAYVAVGARSVEDQQHRLTASGVEIPVGMKNPTGGNLQAMMNGIYAAHHSHTFIYRGWEAHSKGNPYAHAVLRGYTDINGNVVPNYQYENIMKVNELYEEMKLEKPALIIDANHSNSGKNPFLQPEIIFDVLKSRNRDKAAEKLVKGFMVESYIEDGNQDVNGCVYGKSITDACLGWEKTERLIYDICDKV